LIDHILQFFHSSGLCKQKNFHETHPIRTTFVETLLEWDNSEKTFDTLVDEAPIEITKSESIGRVVKRKEMRD